MTRIWAMVVANPWVILAGFVALAGALIGSYLYGSSVGKAKSEVRWQKRELSINAESEKKIASANARVLAAERKSAGDAAEISKAYQEKLKENENAKDRAIASARASGLHVPTKRSSCGNAVPKAGPGPSRRDGETRAELSDEIAEYFIAEATRADKIVEQLTACQALATANRNLNN